MDRGTRLGEDACGEDGVESGWGLLVEVGVGGGRRGGWGERDGDSPVPNRPLRLSSTYRMVRATVARVWPIQALTRSRQRQSVLIVQALRWGRSPMT